MYAIYRERSLVFIERITRTIDGKEVTTEEVVHSASQNEYSTYPWTDYNRTYAGYSLVKWGVNGYDTNSPEYPRISKYYSQDEYNQVNTSYLNELNKETTGYKAVAESKGSLDVKVYTIYAAKVEVDKIELTASIDPTEVNPTSTVTYTLPASMNSAAMKYILFH